jgi:hypothetical protein
MDTRLEDAVRRVLAKRLFFIAGTEKSGTTWLQVMMDAHPEVACRGEGQFGDRLLPFLGEAVARYNDMVGRFNFHVFRETGGFPTLDRESEDVLARTAIGLLLARYGDAPAVKAVGEKTPHTVRHISRLETLFPEARFIFLVRDGRDVATSMWFFNQRGLEPGQTPIPLAEAVRHHARLWRRDLDAIQAFLARRPEGGIILRYEDLHADAPAQLARPFRLLGLAADPAICDRCAQAGDFARWSGGRERGQADAGSLFRKGIVGDWKNHFDPETRAVFQAEAGDALARFGYEPFS